MGLSNNEWGVIGWSHGQFCHPELGRGVVTKGDPAKHGVDWKGQQGFGQGDRIGLLLDSDCGTLMVYKNDRRLGMASENIPKNEPLCFLVGLRTQGDCVSIRKMDIPDLPEGEQDEGDQETE